MGFIGYMFILLLGARLIDCGVSEVTRIPTRSEVKVVSRSGFIGCRFSGDICMQDETCVDDNLFGSCEKSAIDHSDRLDMNYELKPDQLHQLSSLLHALTSSGYTWRHLYTQCIITRALLQFRHSVLIDEDFCDTVATSSHRPAVKWPHGGSSAKNGTSDKSKGSRTEYETVTPLKTETVTKIKSTTMGQKKLESENDLENLGKDGNIVEGKENRMIENQKVAASSDAKSSTFSTTRGMNNEGKLKTNTNDRNQISSEAMNVKRTETDTVQKTKSEQDSGTSTKSTKTGRKSSSKELNIEDLLSPEVLKSLTQIIRSRVNDNGRYMTNREADVSVTPPRHTPYQPVIGGGRDYDEIDRYLSSLSRQDLLALKQFLIGEAQHVNNSSNRTSANQIQDDTYLTRRRQPQGQVPPLFDEVKRGEWVRDNGSTETTELNNSTLTDREIDSTADETRISDSIKSIVDNESSHHHDNQISTQIRMRRSALIAVYVLVFILCALVAVAMVMLYFYQCRGRGVGKSLRKKWVGRVRRGKGYTSDLNHDDYQDLCRQRMLDNQSEVEDTDKEEELSRGDLPTVKEGCGGLVRSISYGSGGVRRNGPTAAWVASAGRSLTYAQDEEDDDDDAEVIELDVTTGHLILSYMEDLAVNADRLCREWHALCEEACEGSTTVAKQPENLTKNRTTAVLPYEHTRVRLDSSINASQSDYINASHLSDSDPRSALYIACQAPLSTTVNDFWQMVWEQGCVVIVSLTTLTSSCGSVHCHRYWPRAECDRYHIYEVTLMSEHSAADKTYIVRNFSLRNVTNGKVRTVTQFQYLAWPDHSVPASVQSLLHFRDKVNKSYRGQSSPIIVHCSDGAGRTGTYCLIDLVLNRIVKGVKEIDLAATLEHLRDQRMNLVHSQEQFEFAVGVVIAEVQRLLKVNRQAYH